MTAKRCILIFLDTAEGCIGAYLLMWQCSCVSNLMLCSCLSCHAVFMFEQSDVFTCEQSDAVFKCKQFDAVFTSEQSGAVFSLE